MATIVPSWRVNGAALALDADVAPASDSTTTGTSETGSALSMTGTVLETLPSASPETTSDIGLDPRPVSEAERASSHDAT
ncbi:MULTISPECIES: hypothetical protein [unclassified Methylobacterium]|uniref:hypothetical protein n=1 Tax=unclassified Methylobacterium TaxID=2615210 RepID=UPI001A973214|nr:MULTISPECIES: hypothetical protein [unclassified Methylobacterium]MBO1020263.1 hypothetical protein [Methylobacterium sp. SD274]